MTLLFVFIAGLIFGAGLIVSGMTNPAVVLAFLDITGAWNPALLFVMGSAVVVTTVGYHFIFRLKKPLFANHFSLPVNTRLDAKLVAGAMLFGVGWGLVGLCPGPALASLTAAPLKTGLFVLAMLAGSFAAKQFAKA